jgi:hypothetical protein
VKEIAPEAQNLQERRLPGGSGWLWLCVAEAGPYVRAPDAQGRRLRAGGRTRGLAAAEPRQA